MTDALVRSPLLSSPTIAALVGALSKAQSRFALIEKDKKAVIATKGGSHYSYSYADLATVLAAVRGPLAENELVLTQPVAMPDGRVAVTTLLAHTSGEWIATTLAMPVGEADVRGLASLITYLRRYGAICLLGVAPADEDDDAGAMVATPSPAKPRAAAPLAPTKAARPATRRDISVSTAAPDADDPLATPDDRRHFFQLGDKAGWSRAGLQAELARRGITDTATLRRSQLDEFVRIFFLQRPPADEGSRATREPGEEG